LAISVEGPTEEEFVNKLIVRHLRAKGVETQPVSIGGNITVSKLAQEMVNLYWRYDFTTSLVDFYGFRGKERQTRRQIQDAVFDEVNRLIRRSWDQRRVFPYIQRHEFEGLIFSDVDGFSGLGIAGVDDRCLQQLRRVRDAFKTPEDINDNHATAPSKRIQTLIPRYSKLLHGPLVAEAAGLDRIRAECPRFNTWLTHLESLPDLAQAR
jgi:hypothetical protein